MDRSRVGRVTAPRHDRITRVIRAVGEATRRPVSHPRGMSCLHCTIVVSGVLSEGFSEAFAGLKLTHEGAKTQLCGTLTDRAEFEGVVRQLFNLGLEVESIVTHPGEAELG